MRQDMQRVKVSTLKVGQILAYVKPSLDHSVDSLTREGGHICINGEHWLKPSEYVFILKGSK
jgi:hypothetical protein